MYTKAILTAVIAASAAASPLKPRQATCNIEANPYKISAVAADGTTYPLAVTFAAAFGQTLRLTANPSQPFTGTEFTESHGSDPAQGYVFTTPHKTQTNPNGPLVDFRSTVPTNSGEVLSLAANVDGAPGLEKTCESGVSKYSVAGSENDWYLCDGDNVDQVLGRKLVYYGQGPSNCQSVSLNLVPS